MGKSLSKALENSAFSALALFFHFSLPKTWHVHSHKNVSSKLKMIGLKAQKVWSLEIENCSLRKHLKLGAFWLQIFNN